MRYPPMGTTVNPEIQCDLKTLRVFDCGDIDASLSLEAAHTLLDKRVTEILASGTCVGEHKLICALAFHHNWIVVAQGRFLL